MKRLGAALYQWSSPGSKDAVPRPDHSIGPPRRWHEPTPSVT
jgi:hypothetical protein